GHGLSRGGFRPDDGRVRRRRRPVSGAAAARPRGAARHRRRLCRPLFRPAWLCQLATQILLVLGPQRAGLRRCAVPEHGQSARDRTLLDRSLCDDPESVSPVPRCRDQERRARRPGFAGLLSLRYNSPMSLTERLVAACCRVPRLVTALFVALGIAGAMYTAAHFKIDTDSTKLISPEVDWRKHEIHFDSLFPQQVNLILIVVDGKTPELAEAGAQALNDALAGQTKRFASVRRPDGGDFFNKNGLLFLPLDEVRTNTEQMIAAAPFLGPMAADPSLRGIMASLQAARQGVAHCQATLEDLQRPIHGFGETLAQVADGHKAWRSWRALVTGAPSQTRDTRRFIEVQPRLDFTALQPGADASAAIRATARSLHLTQDNGVRVRLTGPVPLSDEEFATLAERAALMGIAMMAAVTLTLWLAVRSFKIIFAILLTLAAGLAITMAAGLYIAHVFNIISIAFVALFVGLGVDFGIQFCVRYRHERFIAHDLRKALIRAGRSVGKPLALAAAATAAGFFSFLPTS